MDWRYSVGNLVARAARAPAAVSPATEDAALPLSNLGAGYPDKEGALEWRADGAYAIDFDLNLLAEELERADAPTGWLDVLNVFAGAPGLPANPPDWGAYGGRNPALRVFRPSVQVVDVLPGETTKVRLGLYRPTAAAGATGARLRIVDRSTGKSWDTSYGAWTEDGVVAEQTVADTWLEVDETIDADPARTERAAYLVVIEPIAAAFDATSFVYASANGAAGSPVFLAEVDAVAIVGHELPEDAVVAFEPQPAGTDIPLALVQPSAYAVAVAPQLVGTWRLTIQMPDGLQPRPKLGEVWLGTARTLLAGSPVMPIGVEELAAGQIAVEGARRRREVVPDPARPVAELALQFRARDDAAFLQIRAELARLTRFGADPLLLLPGSAFDGAGRVYHGRLEDRLAWTIVTRTSGDQSVRAFGLPFVESLFAGAGVA